MKIVSLIVVIILFSSCATIFGGSSYIAHVKVDKHPLARISYNGKEKGVGDAFFKVKRRNANLLAIIVKDSGCETQVFNYTHRNLRVWPLALPLGFATPISILTAAISSANSSAENSEGNPIGSADPSVFPVTFIGTLIFIAGPIVIPDLITGAYWQPDVAAEKGVTKQSGKYFNYNIDYTGCKVKDSLIIK